jgi:riboflavin biosynthesis pyrimidine reductase
VRAFAETSAPAIIRASEEESGGKLLLTEGGPTLLGRFLRDRALDELFLTLSPRIAGRSEEERRVSLVEGTAFDPADAPKQRLLAVKSADDYLFLRLATA